MPLVFYLSLLKDLGMNLQSFPHLFLEPFDSMYGVYITQDIRGYCWERETI